jgi:hypothetical protein
MTHDEIKKIKACLVNLDVALVGKTPKAFMRVMVWQAREDLRNLIEDKMSPTSECPDHEKECGK